MPRFCNIERRHTFLKKKKQIEITVKGYRRDSNQAYNSVVYQTASYFCNSVLNLHIVFHPNRPQGLYEQATV